MLVLAWALICELPPEAKDYHQQYLKKNPYGYCPGHGTGVSCPLGGRQLRNGREG